LSEIHTNIIPEEQLFYNKGSSAIFEWTIDSKLDLDLQAICTFVALGFMLDDDTFFNEIKTFKPATKYTLDENNIIIDEEKYWKWHYSPKDSTSSEILEEFATLFENIIQKQIENKSVLLPISGGLDSRTLFVPLKDRNNITLASYEFEGGLPESETGSKLSQRFNIPFYTQKIQKGYLWNKLEDLYKLNNCFTDFTHPRQMDVAHQWKELGDVILLGHWGDILFDKQADSENISYNEQISKLKKKILKPGGMELADDLWKSWDLKGSFGSYITDRLDKLYSKINIDHPSAKMRAFKSLYWAPRWTSINLSIFKRSGEIILPYYNNEMCKFICTVPEKYLEGRNIQIEYIKKYYPEVARIPWQEYYPLNLYQYQWFNHPVYYPVRVVRKLKRLINNKLLKSSDIITRNWELQFLGTNNFLQIKEHLANLSRSSDIIPQKIIDDYLEKFQGNPVKYAHPLSMLLTLSVFIGIQHQE